MGTGMCEWVRERTRTGVGAQTMCVLSVSQLSGIQQRCSDERADDGAPVVPCAGGVEAESEGRYTAMRDYVSRRWVV